jgi:uncharacterized membrane protein
LFGLPEGWGYKIFNDNDEQINTLNIEPEETVGLVIEITTDTDASIGVHDFVLRATHLDETQDLLLSLRVAENVDPVYLSTKYPDQTVEVGDSITYSVEIENPTTESETLDLRVDSLPEGWRAEFMNNEGLKIGSVHVEPESSETLRIKITPDLESEIGEYPLGISAVSGSLSGSLQLNINLIGSHDGVLTLSSLYEKLEVGELKIINVKLTNTGYSDITNIRLSVESSSENIITEIEPYRVNRIKPGESATVTLSIKAIEGTSTGDYVLKIKAVSNEYNFESKQIRVSLSLGNRLFYISGGLLVLGLGSLVLVLRFIRRK